jgi:iron complex transport system ATP-binding protein
MSLKHAMDVGDVGTSASVPARDSATEVDFEVAAKPAAALRIEALSLRAGSRILLDALTLEIAAGESWCIAGPNGAGKTTLVTSLAGLRPVDAGRVLLHDRPIESYRPEQLARHRAVMPQTVHDVFSASVLDVVLLARHPYARGWGWEDPADRDSAFVSLRRMGLEDFAARDVTTLSGGERQRVALATALCQQVPLLLLDEPLAHLDLHHQVEAMRVLHDWVRDEGGTLIFSCHDLNLARRYATHALLLDGHGAAHAGPVREVLTAELTSQVFGHPLILISADGHEALVPDHFHRT